MKKHIRLIAPSFSVGKEQIKSIEAFFIEHNFKISFSNNLLGEDIICANTDKQRSIDLIDALLDPQVDIVMPVRGGYGCSRIIENLHKIQKPEKEKVFIGFSDCTVIHSFLNNEWDWPTIHGAAGKEFISETIFQNTKDKTLHALLNGWDSIKTPRITPLNDQAKKISTLHGKVIGGNLCLVEASIATCWQIQASNKILFLEETGERGYRVDRMLVHLIQSGMFKDAHAIILGDFLGGKENDGSRTINSVLERFAQETHVPVFKINGYGHGEENLPLVFNKYLDFKVVKDY
jgi:muramoyltetrapeptide carboxypeptidase